MNLAEIQEAIRSLPSMEQDRLRIWLDGAPLDVEKDSPELEAGLLRAVNGFHGDLQKSGLEQIAGRVARERREHRMA